MWITSTSFRTAGQSLLQVVKKTYNTEEVPEGSSVPILKKGWTNWPYHVSTLKKHNPSSRTREFKWDGINDDQYLTKNAVCPSRQSICILYAIIFKKVKQ